MAKYFLTHKAVEDLSEIWNYTYDAWSESQADKYYALLIDAFEVISRNPGVGRSYVEIDSASSGFRVGKHIVFYRLISSGEVEVVRILHQSMDLKNRMDE